MTMKQEMLSFARSLRQNQTDAEKLLWSKLRRKQFGKFRRQQPLEPYIVDFVCFEHRLVIELDGGQHNDMQTIQKDARRTGLLEYQGYRVLRFWNNDVLSNIDGVLEKIQEAMQ